MCYILQSLHELDNYLASVVIYGSLNFIQIMSRGHCYYHLCKSLKRASYGQFSCDIFHSSHVCFLDIFDEIESEELLFIVLAVSALLTTETTKGHSFTELVL